MTEVVVNGLDVSYLREGHRVSDHGGGTRSGASCRLELSAVEGVSVPCGPSWPQPSPVVTALVASAPPRVSIGQFGIVRRLHASRSPDAKRRGQGEDAGIRGSACGGCGHVDRLSA